MNVLLFMLMLVGAISFLPLCLIIDCPQDGAALRGQ